MHASNGVVAMQAIPQDVGEKIAIIGIGCRFPGGGSDPESYWRMLLAGTDAIVETPRERWDVGSFYGPERESPGKSVSRWGGYLQGVDVAGFDAAFFKIAPREAENLDPQQRLLLEVTWEALEDAGQVSSALRGSATGVFIGGFTLDYKILQFNGQHFHNLNAHTAVGSMMTMLSNRISYCFDFRGPSLSIDTACSSSLVAVHTACQSLRRGECSLAVAGGALLLLSPQYTIAESKGGFLSPDGRCKAFDSRANGYVRGEGVGVVLLKPLSQALRDGDPIHAVIRGSAANQDGASNGITVPRREAQEQVLLAACHQAGIEPGRIQYVEAHGTGTPVGDPIEATALGTVLAKGRAPGDRCWIGSVKTNIGHLEAASGVAGLVKAALCLEKKRIPPNLHLQRPNPAIDFERLCIRVPTEPQPWPEHEGPALAGVNSFGFGGTNSHVILEERPELPALAAPPAGGPLVLPLSARSEKALEEAARRMADHLGRPDAPALHDACYTAARRREHHDHRLAVVAGTRERAVELLGTFLTGESASGVVVGRKASEEDRGLVFVFSGMGPQWWGMGRQLLRTERVFREAIEACDAELRRHASWSLLDEMTVPEERSRMAETQVAQPANFAIQVALAALWRSWGIEPSAIVGHSTGEAAAAHVAGVYDLAAGVALIYHRSRLQQTLAGRGRMAAVGLPYAEARRWLEGIEDRVGVAAINAPSSVTLSGHADALDALAKRLGDAGVFCKFLRVEVPYHSPVMEEIKGELTASLAALSPRPARVPLFSTVTGTLSSGTEWDAAYWCRNVREPVFFADAIGAILDAGHRRFLEVGPHPVLSASVKEILGARNREGQVFFSLKRGEDEQATTREGLAWLWAAGSPVRWETPYPSGRVVDLPRYPWQRERYWTEPAEGQQVRLGEMDHPLLGRRLPTPPAEWECELALQRLGWIADHRIQGQVLLPGAGYVEMALQALRKAYGPGSYSIEGLRFLKAAFLSGPAARWARLRLDPEEQTFRIHSQAPGEPAPTLHATGRVRKIQDTSASGRVLPAELRRPGAREWSAEQCYQTFRGLGFEYGPRFQGIERFWLGSGEALAELRAPADPDGFALDPCTLDACFQTLITAQFDSPRRPEDVRLPVGIDQLRFHGGPTGPAWAHAIITRNDEHETVGDVRLYGADGGLHAEVLGFHARSLSTGSGALAPAALDRWLYEVHWRPEEAPQPPAVAGDAVQPAEAAPLPEGCWLVFADEGGTGSAVSEELARRGLASVQVRPGTAYRADRKAGQYAVRPGSADDLGKLVKSVGQIAGVLHLWSLDAAPVGALDVPALREASSRGAKAVIRLLKELLESAAAGRLWIVTRGAVVVEGHDRGCSVAQAPVWGLARVIGHQEHVNLLGGIVDLDPAGDPGEAVRLVEKVLVPGKEDQVAFRGGRTHVPRLEYVQPGQTPPPVRFRPDGAYLLTGAFGALGQLVARWMVERGARRLVCMGQTPLPPRAEWHEVEDPGLRKRIAFVQELERKGAAVHVAAVDTTDEKALRAWLDGYAREGWPEILGVVYAAGVVQDQILSQMDDRTFDRVHDPKVLGAWILHRYFESKPLEFFVLFSSIASLVTSTGQGNYAAANAFLDALACHRRSLGLPGLSIGWGPWAIGMVKDLGLVEHYRRRGMEAISAESGIQCLDRVWSVSAAQAPVVGGEWPVVMEYYPKPPPFFSHLAQRPKDEAGASGEETSIHDRLAAAAPEERAALVEDEVAKLTAKVMRLQVAKIDRRAALTALGIDSMMATELRNRIEMTLGAALRMVDLLGGASVADLAAKVLEQRGPALAGAAAGAGAGPSLEALARSADGATLEELLQQVQSLPDDEAARRLARPS